MVISVQTLACAAWWADPRDCCAGDVTRLLQKALERVSRSLDSLPDEEAWERRFAAGRGRIRQLAQAALEADQPGETRPLDDLL